MTVSFKERISRGLDAFAEGMWPLIDEAMTRRSPMGGNWTQSYPGENLQTDVSVQVGVILDNRAQIFRYVLSREEFSWLHEVRDWRNKISHGGQVSHADAFRALDTMERVLTRHAADAAGKLLEMKENLLREKAHEEARKAKPKSEQLFSGEVDGLKPWRDVIQPHRDVAAGRFSAAEFAADLFMVHHGLGLAEYTDPTAFFERTYLTEGLGNLLQMAVRRITGDDGAPPVIDLQTTFGGGKTHSMISLYHLFSGISTDDLPQEFQDLLGELDVTSIPNTRRAVVVGTRFSPQIPDIKEDGTTVGTIWGEIAWQLGGREAFDKIAEADFEPGNPGDHLRGIIADAAPCMILIDEWVAYAAQLIGETRMRGGSFNTQFYFAQALTEIVKSVPGALLVVSLPASVDQNGQEIAAQVSGSDAHEALTKLRDAVGRTRSGWKTADGDEQFEIVRRRLFQTPSADNLKHVAATARAFSEFYNKESAEFPLEAKEADYRRRIERSYPIHPELFTRLYDDWSTLERFQQTRGVLRLMAQVVHSLWDSQDRSPLIMPGLVPMDDAAVNVELVSSLSESWPPIIHRDVDGEDSTPRLIDLQYPNLNQYAATRRVARTILLGSAPLVNSANRGLELQRVFLGSVLPGEQVAVFDGALTRLVARATYLYNEGTRYWYGTQAHVGQLARDRAEQLRASRSDLIELEIRERLTSQSAQRHEFGAVHVMPTALADVADSDQARLVILGTDVPHQGRGQSAATEAAMKIVDQRGAGARSYRNAIVFLAAEQKHVDPLIEATANYLAWQQLDAEKVAPLNLDPLNQKQVEDQLRQANARLDGSIREAYKLALVPTQPKPEDPLEWDVIRCDGPDSLAERTSRRLINQGALNTNYSSEMLRSLLDGVLAPMWKDGHVSIGDLWDVFARYTYLPRFARLDNLMGVLAEGAGRIGWEQSTWALAAGATPEGKYVDLIGGSFPIGVNATWLVVKPDIAARILAEQRQEEAPANEEEPEGEDRPAGEDEAGAAGPTRFWARKDLNPAAAQLRRDFEKVEQEVIAQLQRELGSEVTVTVSIEVENSDGFSEQVVRNVTANADTLKFDDFGFA